MKLAYSENAKREFLALEKSLQLKFKKRLKKLAEGLPPRRHLKCGIDAFVDEVTRNARVVYFVENEEMTILHCFATHKEYERWFANFF